MAWAILHASLWGNIRFLWGPPRFTGWEHKNHPRKYRAAHLPGAWIAADIQPLK